MAVSVGREPIPVLASVALTATGQTAGVAAGACEQVAIQINVTAVSGTPSMLCTIEWSNDGGTTWATADPADTFTAITTAVSTVKLFTVKALLFRVKYTISGGTPSLTTVITALPR